MYSSKDIIAYLREQRFDVVAQGCIACTRFVEKRVAFALRAVQPSMTV